VKAKKISSIFLIFILAVLFASPGQAEDLTGEEIMTRVDENQFIAAARLEAEMRIIDRDRESVKEMIMYVESDGEVSNGLVEFINPRDRGTKYLLLDDRLWMHFPDAEDLVPISGHMLREGLMGSDFSYQDALESEQLTRLYQFEKLGRTEINERQVYEIEGVARPDQEPAYHNRKFWVDVERFVVLREEMYARDGRLLKVMETEKVEEVQEGRWMATAMIMEDQLREDSRTIYRILEIDLDYEIPPGKISLETLQ